MNFLLQRLLLEPHLALDLNNDQLNQLLSQARSTRLLAAIPALQMNAVGFGAFLINASIIRLTDSASHTSA